MRLLALPLTRARPGRPSLVYYLAHLPPKPTNKPETRINWLVKTATNKAVDTWTSWGKAPQSNWKFKVHALGEKAQARLDFEELALKSIDPALGPRITAAGEGAKELEASKEGKPSTLSLIYPSSFQNIVTEPPLQQLNDHAKHRGPKHKRLFYLYAIAAPFTAPFMIIPIIPNIPFFFCVWRAWSNFRAYKAASYLNDLISLNFITGASSKQLDAIYTASISRISPSRVPPPASLPTSPPSPEDSPASTTSTVASESPFVPSQDDMVLDKEAVPLILRDFALPSEMGVDLSRAIDQATIRLKNTAPPPEPTSPGEPKSS